MSDGSQLTPGSIERIRALAQRDWWATNEDLLESEGVVIREDRVISTLTPIIGRKDAIRRRVELPDDYLDSLNESVSLLKEYGGSTEGFVTLMGFNRFLADRGLSPPPEFMWRTLTELSGVNALRRRPQKFSYNEQVGIVDRFLSERNASGYTLDDFRRWLVDWHGTDLSQVIRLTLGNNSWNRTKGLIFLLHKEGAL